MRRTGTGGRVVLGSWYPDSAALDLGLAFHRSRLRLITSQVHRGSECSFTPQSNQCLKLTMKVWPGAHGRNRSLTWLISVHGGRGHAPLAR